MSWRAMRAALPAGALIGQLDATGARVAQPGADGGGDTVRRQCGELRAMREPVIHGVSQHETVVSERALERNGILRRIGQAEIEVGGMIGVFKLAVGLRRMDTDLSG